MNLIQVKEWKIERGQDIDGGMLFASFARYLYRSMEAPAPGDDLYDRLDTGFDRLHGGCLFLAFAAMAVLEELVDWDRWGNEQGGVFAYDHLEGSGAKPFVDPTTMDLAAFLLREIPDEAWYQIAENWEVPIEDEFKPLLTRWCRAVNLPLKGDDPNTAPVVCVHPDPERTHVELPYDFEDFGLNLTELQDKYAAEQEHPEYTNLRWGREAPTTPYWDWVMACIAKDDDDTE